MLAVFLCYGDGMSAIEFAGVEFTFSQLSGDAKVFEWEFSRDGAPMSVADVVFSGVVVLPDGEELPVVVDHVADEVGVVRVSFPRLEVGTYRYEVRYQSAAGDVGRVVFGRIGVQDSALLLNELEWTERDQQRLVLKVPREAGGQLLLEWRAGSVGAAAAEKLLGVDATLDRLAAQVEEFRVFTVKWHNDIASVLVMNPVTGTIWVDGHDTGQRFRGEDGKAPRVNAYGFWEVFENGAWSTLPYKAIGRDGVDGDQVRRVLLNSRDELPEGEERGVLYYVPLADGYEMWAWLENAGWVNVGQDAYGVASEVSLGLVMLGTDVPVVDGAPVGLKDLKLHVPLATDTVPGVVRPSSAVVSDEGGLVHMSASGSLLGDVATVVSFGGVKVSTATVLTEGGIIGMNADGQLLVRLATPEHAGAVLPGSKYDQLVAEPYMVAVGVNNRGALANCLVRGGALQHRLSPDGNGTHKWGDDDEWIAANAFPVNQAHYLGVRTTKQFDQTEDDGLILKPATEERLAGVKLATGKDDVRDEAVPRGRDVVWKGEVYDKAEADERFMSTRGGCISVQLCGRGEVPPANEQEKGVLYIGL